MMKTNLFCKRGLSGMLPKSTIFFIIAINILCVQNADAGYPASERQVGIFYFTNYGHHYYEGSMGPDDSWIMNGQSPAFGPTGSGNFWGKPLWAATHTTGRIKDNYLYYFNKDTAQVNADMIDWHADLIKNANIDFIILDFTNRLVDYAGGPSYFSGTKALCKRYEQRFAAGLPTPKIVFWVRNAADLATAEKNFFSKYDSHIFYSYLGKKLLLVADAIGNDIVNDPNQPAVPVNGSFANYTTRHCWGNMSDNLEGTSWQFKDLDDTPPAAFYYNGQPEEMCAPVANQGCSNGNAGGPGRQNGTFFIKYMTAAKAVGPKFLFVHSFNEWTAGNYSTSNSQVSPSFVDQWCVEGSSDIEPHYGGYELGNSSVYYELVKEQISEFKESPTVLSPYNVFAAGVPGVIEAENFDYGGEGVAYHDEDETNHGGKYRNIINAVDLESSSTDEGGYNIGWTATGEWTKYSVNIAATGLYTILARVSSVNTGGSFRIEVDGFDITGSLTVPNTGAYQAWQNISKTSVVLSSGYHVIRFYIENGGFNISKLTFVLEQASIPDGVYKLLSCNAGKCLDVQTTSGLVAKYSRVQQLTDNGSTGQMWKITNLNNGYYRLSSVISEFKSFLRVSGGSADDGAYIQQYIESGTEAEQWLIANLNNGYYTLTARCSGKCMEVADGSKNDGAIVQQNTANGKSRQQWQLNWVTSSDIPLRSSGGTVGIVKEKIFSEQINLYPNPVKDFVTINGINGNANVTIIDLQGKIVFSKEISSDSQINVSAFDEGIYIVNVRNAETSENKKLIIKR